MSDQKFIKPNWDFWGHIPSAKLWEVVALSLNFDPIMTNLSPDGWYIDFNDFNDCFHVPPELEEFKRRFKIAMAHAEDWDCTSHTPFTKASGLKTVRETDNDRSVRLTDFAEWANERGFSLPPEFPRKIKPPASTAGPWPWGDHETELLRRLAEAATKFWKNYDPEEIDTAPTNKEVSEWLRIEKKVSKRTAEVIASILRHDKLPTGPRK